MKGDGTKEHALIQILCSKEANEIKTLRAAYKKCDTAFDLYLLINLKISIDSNNF